MTDQNTTTADPQVDPPAQNGAQDVSEGVQDDRDGQDGAEGRDPAAKARSEARNLRSRLKAAEAERDALSGTLDVMRRGEVVRLATGDGKLSDGADLFLAGVELSDLLGDDGSVDPAKVDAAVGQVLAERPYWRAGPRTPRPDPVQRWNAANSAGSGMSWSDALKTTP